MKHLFTIILLFSVFSYTASICLLSDHQHEFVTEAGELKEIDKKEKKGEKDPEYSTPLYRPSITFGNRLFYFAAPRMSRPAVENPTPPPDLFATV